MFEVQRGWNFYFDLRQHLFSKLKVAKNGRYENYKIGIVKLKEYNKVYYESAANKARWKIL